MSETTLTSIQLKAISCILESKSIEEAARKTKVSRGTIYNWLKEVPFTERLKKERNVLFNESLDLLKQASAKAVKEQLKLLDSQDETIRRLVSKEIICMSIKIVEMRDYEERLVRLENIMQSKSHLL